MREEKEQLKTKINLLDNSITIIILFTSFFFTFVLIILILMIINHDYNSTLSAFLLILIVPGLILLSYAYILHKSRMKLQMDIGQLESKYILSIWQKASFYLIGIAGMLVIFMTVFYDIVFYFPIIMMITILVLAITSLALFIPRYDP